MPKDNEKDTAPADATLPPTPTRIAMLSDIDLLNIIIQRKQEPLRQQRHEEAFQWCEVQRALIIAAKIPPEKIPEQP